MMRLTSLILSTIVLSTRGTDMEIVAKTTDSPAETTGGGDPAPPMNKSDGDIEHQAAMQDFTDQAETMIQAVQEANNNNTEILRGLHEDCQKRINASLQINAQLLDDNIRRDLTIVEKVTHNGELMSAIKQSLTEHESTRSVLTSLESRIQLAIQFSKQSYEGLDLSKVKEVDIGREAYLAQISSADQASPSNAAEFSDALTALEGSSADAAHPGNEGGDTMKLSLLQREKDAVRQLLVDPTGDMFTSLHVTLGNIKDELKKAKTQLEAECDERLANLTKTNENLADEAKVLDTNNASAMETGHKLAVAHSHVTNTTEVINRRVNALLDFFIRTKQSVTESMQEAEALEAKNEKADNVKVPGLIQDGHGVNGAARPESSLLHPSTWFGFNGKSV